MLTVELVVCGREHWCYVSWVFTAKSWWRSYMARAKKAQYVRCLQSLPSCYYKVLQSFFFIIEVFFLQCFVTVGWVTGRASGL